MHGWVRTSEEPPFESIEADSRLLVIWSAREAASNGRKTYHGFCSAAPLGGHSQGAMFGIKSGLCASSEVL